MGKHTKVDKKKRKSNKSMGLSDSKTQNALVFGAAIAGEDVRKSWFLSFRNHQC